MTATTALEATPTASLGTEKSSPSTTSSSTSGLSTGAKAGIGVGVGLGGLAMLAGLAFLLVRRLRKPVSRDMTETSAAYHPGPTGGLGEVHPEHQGYYQGPKPEDSTARSELPSPLHGRY